MKLITSNPMNKKTLLTFAAAAVAFSASASAQVVFSEGFEGLNDGQQLFTSSTLGGTGQTFPGAEVTLKGADYSTTAPANSFGGGDTALYFNDSSTTLGGNLVLREDDSLGLAAAYDATKAHTFSFDYYYESPTGTENPNMNMNLFIDDGAGSVNDGLNLQIFSGIRQVKNNGTKLDDVAGSDFDQLKIDTWYRYDLTINALDTASDTYDLTITESGGTVVFDLTGLAFGSDIADIDRIEFQGFAATTATHQAYFDNIALTAIPEPGTYALLGGLCALTAVALRRRRS